MLRPALRVLVVDDNDDMRDLFVALFSTVGAVVGEARNGVEALERVSSFRPHVVLMDVAMPVMDGAAAAASLKSNARTRHIPVIAVTGQHGAREDICSACDELLRKPVDPDRLVELATALATAAREPTARS